MTKARESVRTKHARFYQRPRGMATAWTNLGSEGGGSKKEKKKRSPSFEQSLFDLSEIYISYTYTHFTYDWTYFAFHACRGESARSHRVHRRVFSFSLDSHLEKRPGQSFRGCWMLRVVHVAYLCAPPRGRMRVGKWPPR